MDEDLSFERRNILAIDLKSFYASVECIDRNLDPFEVPLAVCDPDRGESSIVMAVSPYLKRLGVPSRCRRRDIPDIPGLILAVPRMSRYLEISARVNDIYLRHVDEDNLHVYSVDESFLDVTDFLRYSGTDDVGMAKRIEKEIRDELGLTVCAGIGENMFLAKVAMDLEAKKRPDFTAKWTVEDVPEKLWPVSPLSDMWGIGSRMEKRLNSMGFRKIGDIAASDPGVLISAFGVVGGELWLHSHGVDRAIISRKENRAPKSLSVGQQLHLPATGDRVILLAEEMARELSARLEKQGLACSSLTLWVGDDEVVSRSVRFHRPMYTSEELEEAARSMSAEFTHRTIYSIGAVAGVLSPREYLQMDLTTDWERRERDEALDRTLSSIRDTFGPTSVMRLSSLTGGSTSVQRANQIGGHRA